MPEEPERHPQFGVNMDDWAKLGDLCCRAEELFGADEIERYAAELRAGKEAEQTE